MSNLNRRDFLKLAGKVTLGAAAVSAIPAVAAAEAPAAPAWPWKYEKLDVAEVQAAVYEHFSTDGGCAAGAVGGILAVLAKNYPNGPYNYLNSKMFADGAGGYGRQNLCGALGGSFAIFGLFCEGAQAKALQKELYAWYESTALPIYLPEGSEPHPAQSVAGSELCRDSYGNWSAKTGLAFSDPIRVNRCRCLTADTAGKAVELLNDTDGILFDPSINGGAEADLFAQGVLKMATCWNLSTYNQRAEVIGDSFEVLPMNFPSDDGVAELCGGIWGFGIFDNGDAARIEAAKTFIKFMTEENAVNAVKASGFSSPRLSQTDVYAGAENEALIKEYESFLVNLGDYYNVMTGWTEARTLWAETLQAIAIGTDVTEAVTNFTNSANALLG